MDWLPIVPLLIIGFFLWFTWHALSPVRFIQQHRAARQRRKEQWAKLQKEEAESNAPFEKPPL